MGKVGKRTKKALEAFSGKSNLSIEEAVKLVKSNGADYFWCNARESALNFYKKLNFKIVSKRFIIPISGPHYKMILNIKNDKM